MLLRTAGLRPSSIWLGFYLAVSSESALAQGLPPPGAAEVVTPPAVFLSVESAQAQNEASAPLPKEPDLEVPQDAAAKPAPYSLPFQLRPVTALTVARSDTSLASYENKLGQGGTALVSILTGAWQIPGTGHGPGTGLAPLIKLALVNDSPPPTVGKNNVTTPTTGGFAIVNPLLGATYATSFGWGLRGSAFFCVTVPIGMGGGDTPNAGQLDARKVGPNVRLMMDNPLFAVNDFAVVPGLDLAYVGHGYTAQLEATFGQLERVRGAANQPEQAKSVFTGGFHAGRFLVPQLSLGVELRYQRWINAPIAVDHHVAGTSVDLLSLGLGPRLHFNVAPRVWIRPGVSYSRGFDHPLTSPGNYNIVQLDVPVVF
jgi:hypothetical protein